MKHVLITGSAGLVGSEAVRFYDARAAKVVGIDNNMRSTFFGSDGDTSWRRAELEATGLDGGTFDVALAAQVLHRAAEPRDVLAEAARLLVRGGRALVMDLLPHREAWVRERLAHRRLGCSPDEVTSWLEAAGLRRVRTEEAARRRGNPFRVLVASAEKEGR